MEMVGAPEGVIGIKEKYHDIIAAMQQQAPKEHPRGVALPDSYPAGDEFILVHIVTGRVIPPGGLPKDVDAMVANVETSDEHWAGPAGDRRSISPWPGRCITRSRCACPSALRSAR
jgi:hypothetical protein